MEVPLYKNGDNLISIFDSILYILLWESIFSYICWRQTIIIKIILAGYPTIAALCQVNWYSVQCFYNYYISIFVKICFEVSLINPNLFKIIFIYNNLVENYHFWGHLSLLSPPKYPRSYILSWNIWSHDIYPGAIDYQYLY